MSRLVCLVALLCIGCGEAPTDAPKSEWPADVLRLKVQQDGAIFADDERMTLDELSVLLATAATENKRVWYYREAPDKEPPPEASKVIQMIMDNNLPVKLSAKPDYSDYVDEEGRSIPDK